MNLDFGDCSSRFCSWNGGDVVPRGGGGGVYYSISEIWIWIWGWGDLLYFCLLLYFFWSSFVPPPHRLPGSPQDTPLKREFSLGLQGIWIFFILSVRRSFSFGHKERQSETGLIVCTTITTKSHLEGENDVPHPLTLCGNPYWSGIYGLFIVDLLLFFCLN